MFGAGRQNFVWSQLQVQIFFSQQLLNECWESIDRNEIKIKLLLNILNQQVSVKNWIFVCTVGVSDNDKKNLSCYFLEFCW